jgi:thioredoxin-like negative regulator of GroEL
MTKTRLSLATWVYCGVIAAASASPAENPGIAWFEDSVSNAFVSARRENKPILLYWGAKWCAPCQQLKHSVFSRSDFIEKSRQFVDVYLDGDDRGAQKWGDAFHIAGYPTVLILRPDRQEIMRISGGNDLSEYSKMLDIALADLRPISATIDAVRVSNAQLTDKECERLAYNAWGLKDYSPKEQNSVALVLEKASRNCVASSAKIRARIMIASTALSAKPDRVAAAMTVIEDPLIGPEVVDLIMQLQFDPAFFREVGSHTSAESARFLTKWVSLMDGLEDSPSAIDSDKLNALAAKLAALKALSPGNQIPASEVSKARVRITAAIAKRHEPYERSGVINAVGQIYTQLGDDEAMYQLFKAELATSATPYYYMLDLGELEEHRGHNAEALDWYKQAYDQSEGIATRYFWGRTYLQALLRLAPAEHERIRSAGVSVIGELDGPDRLSPGTRIELRQLDSELRKWNQRHRYDGDIAAMRERMRQVCSRLTESDPARISCRQFLS